MGPDPYHHVQASFCLSGSSTDPQACCHRRAVRLKGMAHCSNLPGCMTITDTDAPVSIWALLSVLVTAMGVPGGDSSQHRPVGLWGWEGAMTAWACKSRSRLRGCPCSLPSSSLFYQDLQLPAIPTLLPLSSATHTLYLPLCNIPPLLPVWRKGALSN